VKFPIWSGALRGQRWLLLSGGKVVRVLSGTYEPAQTALFERYATAGSTVIDVGAHVGYYTLLASVLVGSTGRVIAFEPNPANANFLRRHVGINHRHNVQVEGAAVSDKNGSARFEFGRGSGTGRLSQTGTQIVNTVRLDDYCSDNGITPGIVKIDVEGAELSVLQGAEQVIRSARPVLFVSTHGQVAHSGTIHFLTQRGYRLQPIGADALESCTEVLATPQ
jgi:FkbM family methyltransferase